MPLEHLPEQRQQTFIGQDRLLPFFIEDLGALKKYILKFDQALQAPHKASLEMSSLVRLPTGGLKAQLYYVTERGKVAVTAIHEAFEKKRRYFFSEAGLIDMHNENYQWIRHLKKPLNPETESLELSTMEFFRLDMTLGLMAPTEISPTM